MIRSIFTNFSARLAVAVLNFIMMLLTTHILGKEIYGQITIIALNVTYIHLISDLAGGPSLVYLTPRASLRSLLIAGTTWSIFNSLLVGALLIYFGVFPALYGKEMLCIGLLISLHSLNQNLLLGQQRIKAYNILFFIQGVLQLLSLMLFIFFFKSPDAYPYIYACIISYGLCYVGGLYLVIKNAPVPQIEEKRSLLFLLFKNGFYTQLASIFVIAPKTIIINDMKSILPDKDGAVGVFNSAFSLGGAIMLFGASVSAILLAKVSNHENHQETRVTVFKLGKLSLFLTTGAVIFFSILPADFYSWLLGGKDYAPVKSIFLQMAPGIIFISYGTVFSHYFSGAGKHIMNFISSGIALLISWAVTYYFIERFGIAGAGIVSSVAYIVLTVCIFGIFILTGTNRKEDILLALPAKGDLKSLAGIFKKEK
jgi:O-antigen/teichoic acid export membrane protein